MEYKRCMFACRQNSCKSIQDYEKSQFWDRNLLAVFVCVKFDRGFLCKT